MAQHGSRIGPQGKGSQPGPVPVPTGCTELENVGEAQWAAMLMVTTPCCRIP